MKNFCPLINRALFPRIRLHDTCGSLDTEPMSNDPTLALKIDIGVYSSGFLDQVKKCLKGVKKWLINATNEIYGDGVNIYLGANNDS